MIALTLTVCIVGLPLVGVALIALLCSMFGKGRV